MHGIYTWCFHEGKGWGLKLPTLIVWVKKRFDPYLWKKKNDNNLSTIFFLVGGCEPKISFISCLVGWVVGCGSNKLPFRCAVTYLIVNPNLLNSHLLCPNWAHPEGVILGILSTIFHIFLSKIKNIFLSSLKFKNLKGEIFVTNFSTRLSFFR